MTAMVKRVAMSVALLAGSVVIAAAAPAGEPSAKAAGDLVALMKAGNLQAFAVPDTTPGRYVAVMLVPGVQLLVVAGQSTSPDYVQAQLTARQYQDVYSTMHAAVVQESKVFFQDMGCDGVAGSNDNIDIMYERGTEQTVFDGNWRRQKLSRSEYEQRVQKADAEYARLLGVLAQGLRASATSATQKGGPSSSLRP
jgi:hypothetical protein